MVAENACGNSIIPKSGVSVKSAVDGLLFGLAMDSREYGVTLNADATVQDVGLAFSRLNTAERQVSVRCRFKVGDIWNQLQASNLRTVRNAWVAQATANMSKDVAEKHMQRIRSCGWVASKWPESLRTDKKGWTHYVKNSPGKTVKKPEPLGLPYLLALEIVRRDDGEWIEGASTGDKHFIMRVPANTPVRDERTHREEEAE